MKQVDEERGTAWMVQQCILIRTHELMVHGMLELSRPDRDFVTYQVCAASFRTSDFGETVEVLYPAQSQA